MKKSPLSYVLLLLKIRDRSSGEIKSKMLEKGYLETDIGDVIARLIENKLVDDDRFVKNLIANEQNIRSSGKRKIMQKLIQRKADPELIQKYLGESESSELERAREQAAKWLKSKGARLPKEKLYASLGRFLAGKGFESNIVYEVLGEIFNKKG